MRICIVSTYPPDKGNLAEYCYYVVNELKKIKKVKKIVVLACGDKSEIKKMGKVEIVRCWKNNSLTIPLGIVRNIKKYKPDLIFFNSHMMSWGKDRIPNFLGAMLPTIIKSLHKRKIVFLLHNMVEAVNLKELGMKESKINSLGYFLAMKSIFKSDRVIVTLDYYSDILKKKYKKSNIRHIPHGTFGRKIEKFNYDGNKLLSFGFWRENKNLPFLLSVFNELRKENNNLEMVIAGKSHPNFPNYLENIKKKYRIPGVTFTGYVPEERLHELFTSSKLIVLPYKTAVGSSGVIHLAASYGKPVIATDLYDVRKIMEEEGMELIIVPKNDKEALKSAIKRLLKDKDLARQIAENNLKRAEELSFNKIVRRYFAVFEEVLGGK